MITGLVCGFVVLGLLLVACILLYLRRRPVVKKTTESSEKASDTDVEDSIGKPSEIAISQRQNSAKECKDEDIEAQTIKTKLE